MSKEVKRHRVSWPVPDQFCRSTVVSLELVPASDYEALLAERDALAKDAERYQLLASTLLADCSGAQMTTQEGALYRALNAIEHVNTLEEIDAIFDAALQGAQP